MTKTQQQGNGGGGAVLPWLRVPVRVASGAGVPLSAVRGLPPPLRAALEAPPRAFRELLPVQAAAWAHLGGGLSDAHDLCLAAPTGSGKTLAYALPLVNALAQQRQEDRQQQRQQRQRRRKAGDAEEEEEAGANPPQQNDDDNDRPLRALIVVPTRDLAVQVHALLRDLCAAAGLRASLAAAQRPAAEEAAGCLGPRAQAAAALLPPMAPAHGAEEDENDDYYHALAARGGGGRADVLVATPGRLTALLPGGAGRWPGLCLARLRFLVVDEADRLLRQAYQDWLPRVLEAAAAGAGGGGGLQLPSSSSPLSPPLPLLPCSASPPFGPGARLVKMIVSATLTRDPSKLARFALQQPRYVALVSVAATAAAAEADDEAAAAAEAGAAAAAAAVLAKAAAAVTGTGDEDDEQEERTADMEEDEEQEEEEEAAVAATAHPGKQQQQQPRPPAAAAPDPLQARFQLPPTLEQHRLVAQAHRKPLALAALLRELGPAQRTLVFCASVDTTRRVYLLLSALLGRGALPCGVAELGGHMPAARRAEAVEALRTGRAGVLVSSDAMARGMDVGGGGGGGGGVGGGGSQGGVNTVVCYDFPPSARAYVHRAGRAARAGAEGSVVSLLKPQEVVHFRRLLKGKVGGGAAGGKVKEWRLAREHLEAAGPALRGAMAQLRELLEHEGVMEGGERRGDLLAAGDGAGAAVADEEGGDGAEEEGSEGGTGDDGDDANGAELKEEEEAPAPSPQQQPHSSKKRRSH